MLVTPVGISASQNRRKRYFKACKLNINDYNRTFGAESERIQKKKKHTHTHYPLVDMLLNDVTTYLSSMIWGSYDWSLSTYLESAYWIRFQWVAFLDICYCRRRILPTPCTPTESRPPGSCHVFLPSPRCHSASADSPRLRKPSDEYLLQQLAQWGHPRGFVLCFFCPCTSFLVPRCVSHSFQRCGSHTWWRKTRLSSR